MKTETKVNLLSVICWLAALSCFGLMYLAYSFWQQNQQLLSFSLGFLGAAAGFLAGRPASIRSTYRLKRILDAALIREKEKEAKSAGELREFYRGQVAALKETIEKEGNELLLKRLREVHLNDVGRKLRELESIQKQLAAAASEEKTSEVRGVRERLEGILSSVSNPEEDDRLIKQFCYSLPFFGNILYLTYMVGKKFDPGLQDRVHRRLNSFAGHGSSQRPIFRVAGFLSVVIFIVGVVTIAFFLVQRTVAFF